MDELRVVRREESALILANELGEEYRLVVDESVAADVRQLSRRVSSASTVRPREIQALLRAGKTRSEVAAETGLEEADVERFEEPVRAEQRYILELAHGVPVRTNPVNEPGGKPEEQLFGQVIAERLVSLGNSTSKWRSWRDEATGWLVGLAFDSRDGDHDAVWSFDHRKRLLSPLTPDATNLSKSGEIGDRLIPKLRAVDNEQTGRFDSDAFDPDRLLAETGEVSGSVASAPEAAGGSPAEAEGDDEALSADAEYARRRDIDHLAVNTPSEGPEDLSQTADLLDALRRRRGERSLELAGLEEDEEDAEGTGDAPTTPGADVSDDTAQMHRSERTRKPGAGVNIWGAGGVAGAPDPDAPPREPSRLRPVDLAAGVTPAEQPASTGGADDAGKPDSAEEAADESAERTPRQSSSKKGRSSIPSWDDILFGTRSDDDPV